MTVECKRLVRLNGLAIPGEIKEFDAFGNDFCLTDIVINIYSYPEGLKSKGSCDIWLAIPSRSTTEYLFTFFIDKYGHQVHLNSGVFCPKGSHLTANAGVFADGASATMRVLLTGYYC